MNFNNIEEGIEHILSRFDRDELNTLLDCSPSELHFSLGIWVKNEIIYNEDCNMSELIVKREKENNPLYREELFPTPHHHEELAHIVIEEIIKSLEKSSI